MLDVQKRRPGRPRDGVLAARRREEILAAAATLFARDGYEGADLDELAIELGVGKGTLYRYFATKRELFLAAVDRSMRLLRESIDASVDGVDDPLERISAGVESYLAFFRAHPEISELLIQEGAAFRDRRSSTYFEHRERNVGRWNALYRDLIRSGRLRDVPVERISDALSALVYGAMFTNALSGKKREPGEQAREILDVVMNGILAPQTRVRARPGRRAARKGSRA